MWLKDGRESPQEALSALLLHLGRLEAQRDRAEPENLERKMRCALRGCVRQKGDSQTHGKEVVRTLGEQSGIFTCCDLATSTNLVRGSGVLPGPSVQWPVSFAIQGA